jgi:hypothetical protein
VGIVTAAEIRDAIDARERLMGESIGIYRPLSSSRGSAIDVADRLLTDGWEIPDRHVPLDRELPWESLGGELRSWSFKLHSWSPLATLVAAYSENGDSRTLACAVGHIVDWAGRFGDPGVESVFAWYDMAVGLRADLLGAVIVATANDPSFDDETLATLLALARVHEQCLRNEATFAWHSNHGLFQAAGLLLLSLRLRKLGSLCDPSVGLERLKGMLEEQVTSDGVHREHSPGYQLLVLKIVADVLGTGIVEDEYLNRIRDGMEESLAWLVKPDGRLVDFGDTKRESVFELDAFEAQNATLAFVCSRGSRGEHPSDTVRGFREGGYFVARDSWSFDPSPGKGSYLAQISAFHSRTHKHADDLSFVWFDRGREILVDAGQFGFVGRTEPRSVEREAGFWYSDPRRQYVESTRAHNTVQIDDSDHDRVGRKRYGSALRTWGVSGDVVHARSSVWHHAVRHARLLLFDPGKWLVVFDRVRDPNGDLHRFRQWFHLAPDLMAEPRGGSGFSFDGPGLEVPIAVGSASQATPIDPVRGAENPELQGWWSPRPLALEPNWAFGFEADQVSEALFVTVFAFGHVLHIDESASVISPNGRQARLVWDLDGSRTNLAWKRTKDGALAIEYGSASK